MGFPQGLLCARARGDVTKAPAAANALVPDILHPGIPLKHPAVGKRHQIPAFLRRGRINFSGILQKLLRIFQVFTVGLKQLLMLCSMFRNFAAYAPHLEITLVEVEDEPGFVGEQNPVGG